MRVVGYLRGPRPGRLDCDTPLLAVCREPDCGASTAIRCSNHRESRCKPCALRYRRRLTRVASDGMARHERSGHMGMLTFTAPSPDEHLGWSTPGRRGRPRRQCGCFRHMAAGMGLWNASASSRWNHLRTLLAREYPGQQFMKAVEVQDRGALHLHVIHWASTPIDLEVVQALALRAGFGCVLDYAPCAPGSRRAAYYVSKYVTKACDQRSSVPWDVVNTYTGEVTPVLEAKYRTWSASRDWGMTMKTLREALRLAAARRAAEDRTPGALPPAGDTGFEPVTPSEPPDWLLEP